MKKESSLSGLLFLCRYRSAGCPFRFAPEVNFVNKTEWDPIVWWGSELLYLSFPFHEPRRGNFHNK